MPSRLFRSMMVVPISLLTVAPHHTSAQWSSIGRIASVDRMKDGIVVSAPPAKIQLSVIAPDVFRIRMSRDGRFAPDSSSAVVNTALGDRSFTLHETPDVWELKTNRLTLRMTKSPCRISFFDPAGTAIAADDSVRGMAWAGEEVGVWKQMPQDEYYFGFGEKAGALQKKWHAMTMWNSDIPAYHADTDPLYQSIPFFYGIRKGTTYGIFLDNSYFSFFNMGKEEPDAYSFGAAGGELNYYFIYGPTPAEVLRKFATLIGTMPMPPRWAIGYQQCRWSYFPESRVREIASNFRTRKIPCDAIYLDIDYMDGYRCFTWDAKRFPNPKKMIGDLANDGFKIVVIIDPGIKKDPGYRVYDEGVRGDDFVKRPDGTPFTGKVWPGECVFPDFTRPATRAWWGSLYSGLVDIGVRGFWNDMNEPSVFDVPTKTFDLDVRHDDNGLHADHRKDHNVYGMQMARGTYEGVRKLRPDERPFVLTRANYAGGNRYAAAWTGDNISSWEHLEMAVPMCLNLSISGQPFVGTDIGGFVSSPSGELYTRWLQLGIFTPLMRTHTEWGSADQEPWSYGPEYEAINRKSIELRYRLLPYLYTQFHRASVDGTPIMRPLFFEYPDDGSMYWEDKEFMFGDALLIAPVLSPATGQAGGPATGQAGKPGAAKRDVRLPAGEWYDFWSGEKQKGPGYVRVDAPIDRIPIFVKAGSIVPQQQLVQYTDQAPIDSLTFDIYPDTAASATMYEDDGVSFAYRRGSFFSRRINLRKDSTETSIELGNPEGSYRPHARTVILKIHDQAGRPSAIRLERENLPPLDAGSFSTSGSGWTYDPAGKMLSIKFPDPLARRRISVRP